MIGDFRKSIFGSNGRILTICEHDDESSSIVLWDNGTTHERRMVPSPICNVVEVKWGNSLFALIGTDGKIWCVDATSTVTLHTAISHPKHFSLRNGCYVGDILYVTGTNHVVFSIDASGQITDISPTETDHINLTGVGFESIAGKSKDELCAVGWDGWISFYDGSHWNMTQPDAHSILSVVTYAPNGTIWAAGQDGALMQYVSGAWMRIPSDTTDTIWSIAWFANGLIYATSKTLFRHDIEGVSAIAIETPITHFSWLDARNDTHLLITGPRTVLLVVGDTESLIMHT